MNAELFLAIQYSILQCDNKINIKSESLSFSVNVCLVLICEAKILPP